MSLTVPLTERQRADLHAAIRRFGAGDRQRGTQYLRECSLQVLVAGTG